eukprot:TRINITY_DN14042_c0_g1_i1.p1 TRINITY_DN14042_c0_g1~~TRINITY_DN14042_c0_g1_i1.p1  ORF type:complete len:320 (+),score=39.70 TRINITY_DN14042_c0_g1_i1:82-1041(+)
MVKSSISMTCELCGTTMPESDWAKHKKGKKHRNKVEKSGADMATVNAAIEKKAKNENENDVDMEVANNHESRNEDIPQGIGLFLRANRVCHPISDGRTRYLSRHGDSLSCHEYRNKDALWKIDGNHIRCDETGKYLAPAEHERDAHSVRLALVVNKPEQSWSIITNDSGKYHIMYNNMYLTPIPLSYIAGLAVDLVLHKYPNLEVGSWDIVRKPEVPATVLYRGKVKMHSKESGTGFISCDETFNLLSRDIYFEQPIDDNNACLTHKIVNFTVKIDEKKGLPFAQHVELCSKADAQDYLKDLDDRRKLKRYNMSSEGSY